MSELSVTKKFYANGTPYWFLSGTVRGKRIREKFKSEKEANQAAGGVGRVTMSSVTADEHEEAVTALRFLREHTEEAIREVGLVELVRWAVVPYLAEKRSPTIGHAWNDFIHLKESQNRREDTIRELKAIVGPFAKIYERVKPTSFTAESLKAYCDERKIHPKLRLNLKHFFAYLSGTAKLSPNPKPCLLKNPIAHWSKPARQVEGIEGIEILTAEEVRRTLEGAAKVSTQRMFVWMLFTGMRPRESVRFWSDARFGWKRIHLEDGVIDVSGLISKTKGWREIRIQPVLKAWLEAYGNHESFLPLNWRDRYGETRKLVPEKDAHDICRHTFISFLLAAGNTWEEVELQAGNSKDIQKKHYARLIRNKADVPIFWAFTPDKFEGRDKTNAELNSEAKVNRRNAIIRNRSKNFTTVRENEKKKTPLV